MTINDSIKRYGEWAKIVGQKYKTSIAIGLALFVCIIATWYLLTPNATEQLSVMPEMKLSESYITVITQSRDLVLTNPEWILGTITGSFILQLLVNYFAIKAPADTTAKPGLFDQVDGTFFATALKHWGLNILFLIVVMALIACLVVIPITHFTLPKEALANITYYVGLATGILVVIYQLVGWSGYASLTGAQIYENMNLDAQSNNTPDNLDTDGADASSSEQRAVRYYWYLSPLSWLRYRISDYVDITPVSEYITLYLGDETWLQYIALLILEIVGSFLLLRLFNILPRYVLNTGFMQARCKDIMVAGHEKALSYLHVYIQYPLELIRALTGFTYYKA